MKKLLIETQPFNVSPLSLTESKNMNNGKPLVQGILATVEVKNGNGRYYKRELWEREINEYMESSIKNNNALGELDHPESQVINLKNVSHIIREVWWDGDNIMGKIEILPTHSGNILAALIENNVTVGVSSRGMGSLKQVGEVLEVEDDFKLLCFDFVSTPSNPGSWMHPLRENLNEAQLTYSNRYSKVNSIITDILCSQGQCPIV
jgi:hypothetical protein